MGLDSIKFFVPLSPLTAIFPALISLYGVLPTFLSVDWIDTSNPLDINLYTLVRVV